MIENEIEYLQRRAADERAAADCCANPVAAEIHLRMAELYERKATELGAVMPADFVQRMAGNQLSTRSR